MNIESLPWRKQTQKRRAENASEGSGDKEMSVRGRGVSFIGLRKWCGRLLRR